MSNAWLREETTTAIGFQSEPSCSFPARSRSRRNRKPRAKASRNRKTHSIETESRAAFHTEGGFPFRGVFRWRALFCAYLRRMCRIFAKCAGFLQCKSDAQNRSVTFESRSIRMETSEALNRDSIAISSGYLQNSSLLPRGRQYCPYLSQKCAGFFNVNECSKYEHDNSRMLRI